MALTIIGPDGKPLSGTPEEMERAAELASRDYTEEWQRTKQRFEAEPDVHAADLQRRRARDAERYANEPERRLRQSRERRRKLYQNDPAYREQRLTEGRARYANPEQHAKVLENARKAKAKRMLDPEYRAKRNERERERRRVKRLLARTG